jgi:hypothetical protein
MEGEKARENFNTRFEQGYPVYLPKQIKYVDVLSQKLYCFIEREKRYAAA